MSGLGKVGAETPPYSPRQPDRYLNPFRLVPVFFTPSGICVYFSEESYEKLILKTAAILILQDPSVFIIVIETSRKSFQGILLTCDYYATLLDDAMKEVEIIHIS